MSINRNAPCPCGSGKKYKRCCMARDQKVGRALRLVGGEAERPDRRSDLAGLTIGTVWQADLAPIVTRFRDDPSARPALALVMAGDVLLHAEVLSHPPAEYEEVAATLESALRSASEAAREQPTIVQLRHAEIARPLADRMKPRGIAVHAMRQLPLLDAAFDDFNERVVHRDALDYIEPPQPGLRASSPDAWAGWGLPGEQIARLFSESASYYRAAPWRTLANEQILHARLPDGSGWALSVLGNAGEEFGLALYGDAEDLSTQLSGEVAGVAAERGAVLSFTFDDADHLARAARQEIRKSRWEVAGESAYPVLIALNTPGGGVTSRQMDQLIALLSCIPRFVDRYRTGLEGDEPLKLPLEWTDAETGVSLRYEGFARSAGAGEALWGIPSELEPALCHGDSARPGITISDIIGDDAELFDIDAIDALIDEEKKPAYRFARRLRSGVGGKPLSDATASKHERNAEIFVDFLARYQGVPLGAVTEYDLRVFLYDWFPRKVLSGRTDARSLPVSLRRFFDYLAEHEGIVCPWAESVLRDTDAYMERWGSFPGGFFWDAEVREWQSELYANLDARVLLHEVHAPSGDGVEWGGVDGTMGAKEAGLDTALQRLWLGWREEVILGGTTAPESVRAALIPRQKEWEHSPNEMLGGATPADTVAREREEGAARERGMGAPSGDGDADDELDISDDELDDELDDEVGELEQDIDDMIGRLVDRVANDDALIDESESLRIALGSMVGEAAANEIVDSVIGAAMAKRAAGDPPIPTRKPLGRGSAAGGRRSKRGTAAGLVYRLRVSLVGIEPPIWRRIQLPGDVKLARLHEILQVALGWEDAHPYLFQTDGGLFGPTGLDIDGMSNAWRTTLVDLGLVPGSALRYIYDFGDRWEHELRVESVEPLRAGGSPVRCLAGERACPPEDCGGIPGYEELLRMLDHPSLPHNPVLEEVLEWADGPWDPELFDIEAVNEKLRHAW